MNKWKYAVIFLVVLSAIQSILLFWVFAFVWNDSYQGRTILLDAVSIQISILEAMIAIVGITVAVLSLWGYQRFKIFVAKQVETEVETLLNKALAKRGVGPLTSQKSKGDILTSVYDVSTKDKEEEE